LGKYLMKKLGKATPGSPVWIRDKG